MRRTSYVRSFLVLLGWAYFAPGSWLGSCHAQVTLLDTTGNLSSTISNNPRSASYYATTYTISMQAGSVYDIQTWTGATIGSAGYYDSYLYILNPSGTVVAADDDSGGGNGGGTFSSRIQYTPPAAGTYTIIVTTYSGPTTLQYRLTVKGPAATNTGGATTNVPNVRLAPHKATPAASPTAGAPQLGEPVAGLTFSALVSSLTRLPSPLLIASNGTRS